MINVHKWNRWFRYFCIFGFVVFGIFAILQLNDPDSVLWTALYTVVALASLAGIKYSSKHVAFAGLAMLYFFGGLFLLYHAEELSIHVEEFREGSGLIIAAMWLASIFVLDVNSSSQYFHRELKESI